MSNFEKNYIGKAKRNEKIEGVLSVTLSMETAKAFIFEYEGKRYLKFEVAVRKETDQYGNTHTVYVNKSTKTEEPVPATETKPKTQYRKK
jgi:GH24 family phage-related lysozyme (muramidase)